MENPVRSALVALSAFLLAGCPLVSGLRDTPAARGPLSDATISAGLREALDVGTANAVVSTGRADGFFRNAAIKILVPEKLQKLDTGLRAIGLGSEVDAFELSMNRAAERAAPSAKAIFIAAIRELTFADVKQILFGGETAATDLFRAKTSDRLTAAFLPVVASSLDEVGATRSYKDLVGRYSALPFVSSPSLDLDEYVTGKALDGLFHVLGEEEKKIRKDPAARVTKLLRDVFSAQR